MLMIRSAVWGKLSMSAEFGKNVSAESHELALRNATYNGPGTLGWWDRIERAGAISTASDGERGVADRVRVVGGSSALPFTHR